MYKVAILGCENSHANSFLRAVLEEKLVDDVEFVGVYSDEPEAARKVSETFGVPVAESYDEFVGKVDGIMITARHGDRHYEYAKPYIGSGIPMFIDKPITCTEGDAAAFKAELEAHNVAVCGGSACIYSEWIQKLKSSVASQDNGKVLGGYFRMPVLTLDQYGGFFFYSQHMVQVMTEIFGTDPRAVRAVSKNGTISCLVRYQDFDVNLAYVEGNHLYYAGVSQEKAFEGATYELGDSYDKELMEFCRLLHGGEQKQSYEDFFAPAYILNAIDRAVRSGEEEAILWP